MMLSPAEWTSVVLSLEVAFLATLLDLPIALGAAWILARTQLPGRSAFDLVVHAPLVLPPVVVGYLLLVVFGTHGLVGHWLFAATGLRIAFTFGGAVMAAAAMALPLMVRAMRLSLDTTDGGLELAARTLGASRLDVFATVTLPLILPGIISGSIVGLARALGEFGATITFAGNIEGETRTIPVAIYTATSQVNGDAAALRLTLVSLTLSFIALYAASWLEARIRRALGYLRPSEAA